MTITTIQNKHFFEFLFNEDPKKDRRFISNNFSMQQELQNPVTAKKIFEILTTNEKGEKL